MSMTRLLDLHAGEIRAAAAAVIAGAVEQRAPGVVGQVAEQQDVVLERLERLQDARQLAELALVVRVPVPHVDAVRHVDERHAHRRLAGAGCGEARESWHPGTAARRRCPCPAGTCVVASAFRVIIIERSPSVSRSDRLAAPRWNGRLSTISINHRLEAVVRSAASLRGDLVDRAAVVAARVPA